MNKAMCSRSWWSCPVTWAGGPEREQLVEGVVVGLPLPGLGSEAASRRPPGDRTGMGVCLQKRGPPPPGAFSFSFLPSCSPLSSLISTPFSLSSPFPSLSSLLLSQLWDLETLLTQIGEKKKTETQRRFPRWRCISREAPLNICPGAHPFGYVCK